MDYTVLFPSNTMGFMSEQDDEIRGVLCRAMNTYLRDMFAEFSDRMTPVALIPMVRPQDALVELEYAVKELGLKAVVLSSYAHRPVTWVNQEMANDPYRPATGLLRHRQRIRLRPGVGQVPRARGIADASFADPWLRSSAVDFQLHAQSPGPARSLCPCQGQVVVFWRRDPPLPRPEVRFHGMAASDGRAPCSPESSATGRNATSRSSTAWTPPGWTWTA